MNEAWLGLGGLTVRLTGGDSVGAAMRIPGMAVFAVPGGKADIELALDAPLPAAALQPLHRFPIVDDRSHCLFGLDAEGRYAYHFEGYGRLRFDPRQPGRVECSPIGDSAVLRFALWIALSMTGPGLGVVPLHASAVVCHGQAVACLGESGTGKSTHTRLWLSHIEGCHLLNDDSPLLAAAADGVWLYGSPWSGKSPCFRAERRPLAALLRLEQRRQNSIRRLGVVEAFAALQPSCPPCLMKEERLADRLVDLVGKVIARTPVYRMGCLPDAGAAQLSHSTIFGL